MQINTPARIDFYQLLVAGKAYEGPGVRFCVSQ